MLRVLSSISHLFVLFVVRPWSSVFAYHLVYACSFTHHPSAHPPLHSNLLDHSTTHNTTRNLQHAAASPVAYSRLFNLLRYTHTYKHIATAYVLTLQPLRGCELIRYNDPHNINPYSGACVLNGLPTFLSSIFLPSPFPVPSTLCPRIIPRGVRRRPQCLCSS